MTDSAEILRRLRPRVLLLETAPSAIVSHSRTGVSAGRRLLRRHGLVLLPALAVVLVVLVRTAWISDDAEITLRTVLNAVHGHGPVFNVGERVDAFTDPAWFLLITLFSLSGLNPFFITLGLSVLLTLGTVALIVVSCARRPWAAALAVGGLVLSKAFVDYSTSGLENPLGAFLVVLVALQARALIEGPARPRQWWTISVTSGLLLLTRVDLLIIVLPLLVLLVVRARRDWRRLLVVALGGAVPVLAWTGFSVVYYGFGVPNTAYAKLGSGIGQGALILQGFKYLLDAVSRDPVTPLLLLGSMLLAVVLSRSMERALALGVLAYLTYVIWIGGDFMAGRFLMVPAVAAAVIIASSPLPGRGLIAAGAVVGLLGTLSLPSTLLSSSSYSNRVIAMTGIADERGFWFQQNGLVADGSAGYDVPDWTLKSGRSTTVVCGGLGHFGIVSGPTMHALDSCGLADPLLARLPATPQQSWRIGHFARALPLGYRRTVESGRNRIQDRQLHEYYDAMRLVTRGDLFSSQRLAAIWQLNTGAIRPGSSYKSETAVVD